MRATASKRPADEIGRTRPEIVLELPPQLPDRARLILERLLLVHEGDFPDEDAGAEIYIALRMRWDRYIKAFAEHMAESLVNIDRALYAPSAMEDAPPFDQRMRIVS